MATCDAELFAKWTYLHETRSKMWIIRYCKTNDYNIAETQFINWLRQTKEMELGDDDVVVAYIKACFAVAWKEMPTSKKWDVSNKKGRFMKL